MSDTSSFPATSRYFNQPTSQYLRADGTLIVYLQRRFLPQPDRFALLQEHNVAQGDRLDNVTATYLSDPEQFWRVADANNAMQPDDLTATVGRKLRITLPEGIPGPKNA
jgi:hypothetical protein